MLRTVERRVLDEMSKAKLAILLENRARVDHEPQLGAFLRPCVLPDVVAQAVGQRSDPELRIHRQLLAERWQRDSLGSVSDLLRAQRSSDESDETEHDDAT